MNQPKYYIANQTTKISYKLSDGKQLLERYRLKSVLGKGGFGCVYAGVRVSDSLPVALKFINCQGVKMDPRNEQLPMEVSLLHKLSHIPGVIKMIEACWLGEKLVIVMERVQSCMDLYEFCKTKSPSLEMITSLFRQLVQTVLQCHKAGIYHRDIKLENVLVDLRTNTIKLIDFGCASHFQPVYYDLKGTHGFIPPEMYRDGQCNGEASEVWSLGVLLYVMVCRRRLYENIHELQQLEQIPIYFPNYVPMQCRNLITSLLQFDWYARPSLEKVLAHNFLQKNPFYQSKSARHFAHHPTLNLPLVAVRP